MMVVHNLKTSGEKPVLIFLLAMKWVSESKLARNNASRPKQGAGPN